jgi:tetratricopeptide (TPR) repeat protein
MKSEPGSAELTIGTSGGWVSAWHDLWSALAFLPDTAQVQKVFDAWWAEPLSEHVWELIKVVVFTIAGWDLLGRHLYRWTFKRRSRLEQRLELAEEEVRDKIKTIGQLQSENKQLSAELEQARGSLPQAAIARAEREWRDRNTVAAVRQLETWFEVNAESIATIALHLAKFHVSRAIPDPGNHLDRARDLLRLARGASPDNREAQELSSELDTVNAGLQEQLIREGDVQIAWNSAMAPRLGAQGEAMLPAVNALREIAQFCFDKGLWRLAPIFADRAADFALSGGSALRRIWFSTETRAASYQPMIGRAAEGLQRIDHILAEARESLPARDVIILEARYARAKLLERLGRYGEALGEIDAFARIQAEVKGAQHRDTLWTRYLRASVLTDLGRYGDAFAEIGHLVPVMAEVRGARHPDTLVTRHLGAGVLERLGRFQDALLEIDEFGPVQVEVSGARHPLTLRTRHLRASIFANLGRYYEALAEIDDFIQIEAQVIGAHHPDTVTRYLRAYVLACLGRYREALAEIDAYAQILAEVLGARHPLTLRARCLRAFVLGDLGRFQDALLEIDEFGPVQVEVSGARHPHTLRTRLLHAVCLANLACWDEALSEVGSQYPIQVETLGAAHVETVLTNSARMGIEIAANRDVRPASELRETIRILTMAAGATWMGTLFARYRLSRLLLQGGDAEQARAEILDTIAHFDPMTDPGHSLLRSAKALLSAIEGHPASDTLIV